MYHVDVLGNGSLNLNANGISNVGKAQLDLGGGEGSIHIPGLGNLFSGKLKFGLNNYLCFWSKLNF